MEPFVESILHVDMDAFFVEVERHGKPELRGVPVIVGGLGNRGVVASASYEARKHGVHSAMPIVHARRLCPNGRFVPPAHATYRAKSREVFDVLHSFTPMVEGLSIDEAFLDVDGLRLHYESSEAIGEAIRTRLREQLSLPASVGIATNKFLAKLASELAKPDGLRKVEAGSELDFLHPLGVRSLWGVGEATYAALEELGVRSIGDLAALPRELVIRRLGDTVGAHLWELAWARDSRLVSTESEPKSVSVEATYETDLVDHAAIDDHIFGHCERLARRLRAAGLAARTVTLKIRFADFSTFSRSVTFEGAVDDTHDLVSTARFLLSRVSLEGRRVRLLGVGGSNLVEAGEPRQMAFGGSERRDLTLASDQVRDRFGDDAVRPARLVERDRED